MNKIRLGLIGCGEMMSVRCRNIMNAENVEITAVCDIKLERAQKTAELFGNPYVTNDFQTMPEYVDAVYIALPNDVHYLCGKFFARNKKHVLVEAPMCVWKEEAETLVETCKGEDVKLMCALPARYRPGIRRLKEMLASGEYGKTIMMSVWAEEYAEYDELHWAACDRLGGNQMFSEAGQYIDVMLWYLGEPVTGSYMGTKVGGDWMMFDSTGTAKMTFENGAIGYICTSWSARGSHLGRNIQIHTEGGMFDFDFDTGELRLYDKLIVHRPGEMFNRSYTVVYQEDMDEVRNTPYEINHFAKCIISGKTPETSGYVAMQGQKAILRMIDADEHNVMADLRGLGVNN